MKASKLEKLQEFVGKCIAREMAKSFKQLGVYIDVLKDQAKSKDGDLTAFDFSLEYREKLPIEEYKRLGYYDDGKVVLMSNPVDDAGAGVHSHFVKIREDSLHKVQAKLNPVFEEDKSFGDEPARILLKGLMKGITDALQKVYTNWSFDVDRLNFEYSLVFTYQDILDFFVNRPKNRPFFLREVIEYRQIFYLRGIYNESNGRYRTYEEKLLYEKLLHRVITAGYFKDSSFVNKEEKFVDEINLTVNKDGSFAFAESYLKHGVPYHSSGFDYFSLKDFKEEYYGKGNPRGIAFKTADLLNWLSVFEKEVEELGLKPLESYNVVINNGIKLVRVVVFYD